MPKSICFIGGGLAGGGQERALSNLANEFAGNGYLVTIICLFKTEVFFEIHQDITVIWPIVNRATANKFIYAAKLIPYIRQNVKKQNPETIVCFGDWFNAYVILATLFLNTKVFITNRMGPNLYLGKFIEFFNKHTYKWATGMIVQTERARSILQSKYKINRIDVVPNAIQPINITDRIREKSIITVGRLSKEKGHAVLIEAFAKLNINDWRLDLVGDGPEMENLRCMTDRLNLKDKVFFHGHQKDFSALIGKASLFVLPSYYEGFPNALIEAMSIPITCISSDCTAGPAEIIKDGVNGYLFETGNSGALSVILNCIIKDPAILDKIETNAYKVREDYDFHIIAGKFLNVILN